MSDKARTTCVLNGFKYELNSIINLFISILIKRNLIRMKFRIKNNN